MTTRQLDRRQHARQNAPCWLTRAAAMLAVAAAVLGQVFPSAAADAKKVFRAGAATSNITPWLGDPVVGGWKSPPAADVHDELHARCFVLDNGSTRIALVQVDSLAVSREVCDAARKMIHEQTDLPEDHVLIAATHTHSATSARPANVLKPGDDFNSYQQFLIHRISDGVRRAIANLEPARIAWGAVDVPEHVHNRRWHLKPEVKLVNPFGGSDKVKMNPGAGRPELVEPAGPTDPQVSFLSIQSIDGRPIGLLANYSLHYVGGTGGGQISADYFAMFADRIQQLLGADRLEPPFVGAMSNGTSGDVNNINFRTPRGRRKPFEQMCYVADDLAQKVFEASKDLKYHDWVPLGMAQRELALAVRKPTPEQLARAKELLAGAEPLPDRPHEETYARRIVHQEESPAEIQIVLQAVRIGDLGITAIPFEVFAEIGLELKERSPLKPEFTIEQANGGYGYLPTPRQHDMGGYETWLGTCKVEKEASVKIVNTLLEMLGSLK